MLLGFVANWKQSKQQSETRSRPPLTLTRTEQKHCRSLSVLLCRVCSKTRRWHDEVTKKGKSDWLSYCSFAGRVRPKVMTAATAILGLLPILLLRLHGTEIERPLAIVMTGGLITSTMFTLLALPTFYLFVHRLKSRYVPARPEHSTKETESLGVRHTPVS